MGNARRLDDVIVTQLVAAQSATTSALASTPSGSWVDIENYDGDLLIVVNVGGGTFSNLSIQPQMSSANTGAGATNCLDPRGAVLTITAAGIYGLALNVNNQPLPGSPALPNFIGLTSTLTGTNAVMSAALIARGRAWSSGAAL